MIIKINNVCNNFDILNYAWGCHISTFYHNLNSKMYFRYKCPDKLFLGWTWYLIWLMDYLGLR